MRAPVRRVALVPVRAARRSAAEGQPIRGRGSRDHRHLCVFFFLGLLGRWALRRLTGDVLRDQTDKVAPRALPCAYGDAGARASARRTRGQEPRRRCAYPGAVGCRCAGAIPPRHVATLTLKYSAHPHFSLTFFLPRVRICCVIIRLGCYFFALSVFFSHCTHLSRLISLFHCLVPAHTFSSCYGLYLHDMSSLSLIILPSRFWFSIPSLSPAGRWLFDDRRSYIYFPPFLHIPLY